MTTVTAAGAGTRGRLYNGFSLLSSLAEGAQMVALLWLTYALTDNAVLIGVLIVLGYLPATVVGLLFSRIAESGRSDRLARVTNLVLATTSLAIAVQQSVSGRRVVLTLVFVACAQVVLSLVKMINKAALNRLLRSAFDRPTARALIASSSSAGLLGNVAGAGVAGLLLGAGLVPGSLYVAAVAYAASAVALILATPRAAVARAEASPEPAEPAEPVAKAEPEPGPAPSPPPPPPRRGMWMHLGPALRNVLIFSVPSSGMLQFMNTVLVPLAAAVAPGRPGYYATLDIATVCGGFAAGLVLARNAVPVRVVLAWALPSGVVLAAAMAVFPNRYLLVALCFLLLLVTTCHVICMQMLTNQVPADGEVGQFAVVRNVVASAMKAAFAFGAGVLVSAGGVAAALVVLAVVAAGFAVAWAVMRPRWPGVVAA